MKSKPASPTLRARDLTSLLEVFEALFSQRNINKLLNLIMDKVTELLKAERSSLFLFDPEEKRLWSRIAQKSKMAITLSLDEGIAGYTARHKKVVICYDTYKDPRFNRLIDKITGYKTRNIISFPMLTSEGEVMGVIEVLNKIKGRFSPYDVRLLEMLASQATVAIQNATLFRETQARREEIERHNIQLKEALTRMESEFRLRYHYGNIVGQSPTMQEVFKLLEKAKETLYPVLIQGESGTGKELIARAIHFNGPRAHQKFLSQNCAAIPESLLEAELFGYVKGAFTGADQDKKGLFALAHQGTLFLDEIGDMSLEMQKRLLRVLQDGEIRPVGGKNITKVDVRIITASNKDLATLLREKKMREDLFYRLNVIPITLPPLRERKEDIPLLVNHFLRQIAEASKTPQKALDKEVMGIFLQYDWPGNVRELENELKKMVALGSAKLLPEDTSSHIHYAGATPYLIRGKPGSEAPLTSARYTLREARKMWEREVISQALQENKWNITRAAKALGIHRPRLSLLMKKHRIRKTGENDYKTRKTTGLNSPEYFRGG